MNPELPPNPRAELEARVTAWLLGELSAEEAAAVQEMIAKDAELGRLRDRLAQTLNLLRETVATPMGETPVQPAPLKLSPERREKLLAHFKTIAPEEFAQPRRRITTLIIQLAAVFAILAILSSMLVPSLAKSKQKGQRVSIQNNLRQIETAKRIWADDQNQPPTAIPTARDLAPYLGRAEMPAVSGETYYYGAVNQQPVAQLKDKVVTLSGEVGNLASLDRRLPELGMQPAAAQTKAAPLMQQMRREGEFDSGVVENSRERRQAENKPAAHPSPSQIVLPQNGQQQVAQAEQQKTDGHGAVTIAGGVVQSVTPVTGSAVNRIFGGGFPGFGGGRTLTPSEIEKLKPELHAAGLSDAEIAEVTSPPSTGKVTNTGLLAGNQNGDRKMPETPSAGHPTVATANGTGDYYVTKEPGFGGGGGGAGGFTFAAGDALSAKKVTNTPLRYAGRLDASATTLNDVTEKDKVAKAEVSQEAFASVGTPVSRTSRSISAGTAAAPAAATPAPMSPTSPIAPITAAPAAPPVLAQAPVVLSPPDTGGIRGYGNADASRTVVLGDTPLARAALPVPVPQAEVLTRTNAFTTFSLNISDVAFKLAEASLQNGVMPDPAGMRSEEFINAFDYRDPEPAPGAPIGFAWERAGDPFAQNRDLLRFSIKTAAQGREAARPLNLVLLLDKSGSMERADRVEIIANALRVLASQLQPQDTLSVVVFARTARLFVDGVPGSQAGDIAKKLRDLTPEGGTNLEEAMRLAYATALRHYLANGENRVVLLTDGAANLGNVDPDALKQNVETNRKQGIALDCFGVGWDGYNDDLLARLSRAGNGRYEFINTPEEAATEFAGKLAGALRVAAADVKVQVEFNPNRVTSYRQIGYAKDQLKKEDFRDNNVKAAQIGAAESGNALYTVEINPAGEGPLGTVHVRFRIPGTGDYQEHEWTLPYTGSVVPLEKASPAMRLMATAAAFSEWLAGSPYAAGVTPDRLLGYLRGVPQVYGADARPTKLEWMIRQAKSISGK
jgi:Mg-chelatase subunit ChlD